MDINKGVYIWVTETNPEEDYYIIDGIAFDGDFGLGPNKRIYVGEMLLISETSAITCISEVSTIHISRKGIKWAVNIDKLPDPPFLLTNNMNLKFIYRGNVNMNLTSEAKKVIDVNGEGIYSIVSTNFIGIIKYKNESFSIEAFSDENGDIFRNKEKLIFSEWDIDAGSLERI